MRCELCKREIAESFLGKLVGTWLRDAKGKRHAICSDCQKGRTKAEILEELGLA